MYFNFTVYFYIHYNVYHHNPILKKTCYPNTLVSTNNSNKITKFDNNF